MTTQNAPAGPAVTSETTPDSPPVAAPPSWPWRRAALLLAGAAQLITISALVGADPPPATWPSMLLAIAPAPLAAVAAFAPAAVARLAIIVAAVVVAVGAAGAVGHTGLFFVPALVALIVGTVKLWREKPSTGRG
jgi:hypothetical protein